MSRFIVRFTRLAVAVLSTTLTAHIAELNAFTARDYRALQQTLRGAGVGGPVLKTVSPPKPARKTQ